MTYKTLNKKTWSNLRTELNNSYDFNDTWNIIIDLFKQRIDHFYFDPIEKILEPNSRKGEGFAIVTLQCALIEMLAAFKYGKIHNREKLEPGGLKFEYKSSEKYFLKFLKSEDIFQNHFFIVKPNGQTHGNTPYDEARTKKDWRINAKNTTPTNKFIEVDSDGVKNINRTILHQKLKSYFNDSYIISLKQENKEGNKLRRFLGRKLDHLHDIYRDTTFEWWKDI
jgi:hypothetical protein